MINDQRDSPNNETQFNRRQIKSFLIGNASFAIAEKTPEEEEQAEDPIASNFKESLKKMEKVQRDLEQCAKVNQINKNMSSFVMNMDRETLSNHCHVSDHEKKMINNQITEGSEYRIRDYSNLFSLITSSLADIRQSITQYNDNRGKY